MTKNVWHKLGQTSCTVTKKLGGFTTAQWGNQKIRGRSKGKRKSKNSCCLCRSSGMQLLKTPPLSPRASQLHTLPRKHELEHHATPWNPGCSSLGSPAERHAIGAIRHHCDVRCSATPGNPNAGDLTTLGRETAVVVGLTISYLFLLIIFKLVENSRFLLISLSCCDYQLLIWLVFRWGRQSKKSSRFSEGNALMNLSLTCMH